LVARRRSGAEALDASEPAVRRLAALAAMLAVGWGSLEVVNWWLMLSGRVKPGTLMHGWNTTHIQVHAIAELAIGVSACMAFALRAQRWRLELRLRAGVAYAIAVGLLIGYNEHLGGWWSGGRERDGAPTWQGLFLVMFPRSRRGYRWRCARRSRLVTSRIGIAHDLVKVLDFGLVKPAFELEGGDGELSAANVVRGTPAFLSPEMITGATCDQRLDLYGLGCVAYWLLTGELVFERDTTLALALAHVHERPRPPSARAPHPDSPELDALVLACLAKAPGDRPESAHALAAALDALHFEQPWTRARAAAWWREHLGSEASASPTAAA
jgi:hypothetical protein